MTFQHVGVSNRCCQAICKKIAFQYQLGCTCCSMTLQLFFFFFFLFWVGKLFITSVKHTCSERTTRAMLVYVLTSNKQTKQLVKQQTKRLQEESAGQAKQAANKAVVHQPRAEPVPFHQTKNHQCSDQPNQLWKVVAACSKSVQLKGKLASGKHNAKPTLHHSA